MISVILIWVYVIATTFIVGYGVLRYLTRHFPYRVKNADAYVVCGLVCVTVYAQFFSLFTGVGLFANVLLCAACAVICFLARREMGAFVLQHLPWKRKQAWELPVQRDSRQCTFGNWFAILVLFLFFAYGTSRGMLHYDTGLYHAQSIRWIEEYGVVRGLGNLHCRLAYNSASFALSALYSMAFLGGQSFHVMAGFLAFVLAAVCLKIGRSLRAGRLRTSDFARLMCIYYLVNVFDKMVSPASDYFMVLLAFYIVIRWLELLEEGEQTILPYGLLCVLGVFLMTVKLSAALILLLVLYPAYFLLREGKWKETGVYLALGFVTALPYLLRNVILSGWLVYPFTQIDLFSVAWKIPKGMADYDAREIQVWGRGYTDVAQFDLPMRAWLPGWLRELAGSDKIFVLAAAAAVLVFLLCVVWTLFGIWYSRRNPVPAGTDKRRPVQPGFLLVQGTVVLSFLFWLCTSPLIRYGCVYVYLTPAVVFGGIYDALLHEAGVQNGNSGRQNAAAGDGRRVTWRRWAERAALVMTALLILYKGFALLREAVGSYENTCWVLQKDYENYETVPYEIEGVTFYYPAEGDQTGYDSFPASPAKAEISFLGDGLKDGFIVK